MANKKSVKKSKSKVVNNSKKNNNDKVFNYVFFGSVFVIIAGILVIMAFIVLKIANSDFIKDDNNSYKDPTVMTSEVSYLESELISYQEVGFNSLVADADANGNPLSLLIDGEETTFEKGYFAHAYSVMMFSFKNIYLESISTYYGINNTKRGSSNSSMIFKIYVDGEELFISDEVNKNNPSGFIEFEINRKISNIIFVIDDGENNADDHGVWADSKISYRGEL